MSDKTIVAEHIGQQILDCIISGGLVHPDNEEPSVLVWSANAPEQIGETAIQEVCRQITLTLDAKENDHE